VAWVPLRAVACLLQAAILWVEAWAVLPVEVWVALQAAILWAAVRLPVEAAA